MHVRTERTHYLKTAVVFVSGMGGYCEDDLQDPVTGPTGYWCALNPPRGQCWDPKTNVGRGCTQVGAHVVFCALLGPFVPHIR